MLSYSLSNIGTRSTDSFGKPIDERGKLETLQRIEDPVERKQRIREHFMESVRNFFIYEISRPELLNRIGSHIIVFNYLDSRDIQRKLIEAKLKDIADNFKGKFSHLDNRSKLLEYLRALGAPEPVILWFEVGMFPLMSEGFLEMYLEGGEERYLGKPFYELFPNLWDPTVERKITLPQKLQHLISFRYVYPSDIKNPSPQLEGRGTS